MPANDHTPSTDGSDTAPVGGRRGAVPDAVVEWVVESCERQGVPVKITDTAVVGRVAVLLGSSDTGSFTPPSRVRPEGDTATPLSA